MNPACENPDCDWYGDASETVECEESEVMGCCPECGERTGYLF